MLRPVLLNLALSVAGFPSVADAQPADRVYPVLQLTDSHVAEIDVTDGSVDDWEYIAGEPTLTPLDFAQTKGGSYDPADMDFRIWLGWHDATDRIFFAMERVDDIYINEFDRQDELLRIMVFHDTSVAFAVDGDHSGGERSPPGDPPRSIEESLQIATQAQIFHALGEVFDGGSRILLFPQAYHVSVDWFSNPPFAHGGGAVGGSPIVSVTEFYVTPFDRFLPLDSEDSDTSDLVAGKIIGFNIEIYDVDSGGAFGGPPGWETVLLLAAPTNDAEDLLQMSTDDYADGVLITPDGLPSDNSAVKSDSWARIKAATE